MIISVPLEALTTSHHSTTHSHPPEALNLTSWWTQPAKGARSKLGWVTTQHPSAPKIPMTTQLKSSCPPWLLLSFTHLHTIVSYKMFLVGWYPSKPHPINSHPHRLRISLIVQTNTVGSGNRASPMPNFIWNWQRFEQSNVIATKRLKLMVCIMFNFHFWGRSLKPGCSIAERLFVY